MTLVQAKSPTATASVTFFSSKENNKIISAEQQALEKKVTTLFLKIVPLQSEGKANLITPDASKRDKSFNLLLAPLPPRMI